MHFDDFIQKNLNKRKPSTDTNIQLHYQNPNNISELFKSPLEFKTQSYQGFMPIVFFFFFLKFFFFSLKKVYIGPGTINAIYSLFIYATLL